MEETRQGASVPQEKMKGIKHTPHRLCETSRQRHTSKQVRLQGWLSSIILQTSVPKPDLATECLFGDSGKTDSVSSTASVILSEINQRFRKARYCETFCLVQYTPRLLGRHKTGLLDEAGCSFQGGSVPTHQDLLHEALDTSPHPVSLSSLPTE